MKEYQLKSLDSHCGKSVDDLWSDFTLNIDSLATQSIHLSKFLINPLYYGLLSKYDDWSDEETTYQKIKITGDQTWRDIFFYITKEKY